MNSGENGKRSGGAPLPTKRLLHLIEHVGLLLILVATLVAIAQEVWAIVELRHVRLADLLLLFIYLEVIAMIGIYYESHQLPVRFPLYIAVVALARFIILDSKDMPQWRLLEIALAILVLAFTVLVIRFGQVRYPYDE